MEEVTAAQDAEEGAAGGGGDAELDPEIFDDDDFCHLLLKDLIELMTLLGHMPRWWKDEARNELFSSLFALRQGLLEGTGLGQDTHRSQYEKSREC